MAHSKQRRDEVRAAYVGGLDLLASAKKFRIPYSTARKWKAADADTAQDWERARGYRTVSGEGRDALIQRLLDDYLHLHETALKEVKNARDMKPLDVVSAAAKLADALNKTQAALRQMASPEFSTLAVALEVLEDIGNTIKHRYPQHAAAWAEMVGPIGDKLGKAHA